MSQMQPQSTAPLQQSASALGLPPLSLYIHIPWCIQKCPYCDFNSHAVKQGIPEQEYISHLLADLDADLAYVQGRELQSIFIGGGTPSVFSAEGIEAILQGVRQRISFASDIEITMEANPGTVEAERFAGYVKAGVSRFSIGVQSFQNEKLSRLGRIHQGDEAKNAARLASDLMAHNSLQSFNLDLMHGLPEQSIQDALYDLQQAIELNPPHLSWYQLTIEPNTAFASKPPVLPQDDILWDIQEQGHALLTAAGYQQYETSAYAKTGYQCRHNLNYWRFGDYLGIGCGAHGKITLPQQGHIIRTVKVKHPKGYMDLTKAYLDSSTVVSAEDLPFEFFMNRFRLLEPCPLQEFTAYTGLSVATITAPLARAEQLGLVSLQHQSAQITDKGVRYLNDLLELFL
ncbi:radical SAM family heme chaperone HemW [Rheinheimera sp. 4Y26]|uniref:radical SAM family heme chaperone HemW n=1 Tax=Rheinheimera sp. 4Y26 TaxID=2977811 RepID=UPI0021B15554|nr:radical SAM family heme chaperone HemW [Rheinheimera sp. 4Y26]MCT6699084.1 radical SAM family heme chaperone HemW [Rheinheimera sp. 4Y26]